MRALILYASSEGQTEKIAKYLADRLHQNDVPTDTYNLVDHSADELTIDAYDAVVIGSPMHYAEYDSRIKSCIRDNIAILKKMPNAFFSVSLGIQSKEAADRAEVTKLTENFLSELELQPDLTAYFAGAVRYSKYGWLKKHLMRWIARKSGETNNSISNDQEYTDWGAVDAFARQFSNGLKGVVQNVSGSDPQGTQQVQVVRSQVSVYVGE